MVGRYLPESFILDTPGRPEPLGNAGFRAASSRVGAARAMPAGGRFWGSGDEVPAVAVSGKKHRTGIQKTAAAKKNAACFSKRVWKSAWARPGIKQESGVREWLQKIMVGSPY